MFGDVGGKKDSFLCLKSYFGRTIVFGVTRKNIDDDKAINMSCRHISPSVFSVCLLMVRSRSLARCFSLELFLCSSCKMSFFKLELEKLV